MPVRALRLFRNDGDDYFKPMGQNPINARKGITTGLVALDVHLGPKGSESY